ncbi:hypothetical protein [Pelagicoccus sp. SDUM812002]|uniref:glycosyltransferase family 9 protein n=1 Tax=Pelagicoccus sp. SDUM812002 TaxID=3041266 RepID=UPI00280FDC6A|nr:hypothetical protein [Pelagicoccus sp. SDUM812002]MDQ8186433.1 hypothetical protein [Pelagicoccus sp. SDUM812002]
MNRYEFSPTILQRLYRATRDPGHPLGSFRITGRNRFNWTLHKTRLRPSRIYFTNNKTVPKITIYISGSFGDIAMNSGITAKLKIQYPESEITLVTHPKFKEGGLLNPDYDKISTFPSPYKEKDIWKLSYQEIREICSVLCPDQDQLIICQPTNWCDQYLVRTHLYAMQHKLAGLRDDKKIYPRLIVPSFWIHKAKESIPDTPFICLFRAAKSVHSGSFSERFWKKLALNLIEEGYTILDNTQEPLIPESPKYKTIGHKSFLESVAVSTLAQKSIGLRSGMLDAIAFSTRKPLYCLNPRLRHPTLTFPVVEWAGFRKMGAEHVRDSVNDLQNLLEAETELNKCLNWALRET